MQRSMYLIIFVLVTFIFGNIGLVLAQRVPPAFKRPDPENIQEHEREEWRERVMEREEKNKMEAFHAQREILKDKSVGSSGNAPRNPGRVGVNGASTSSSVGLGVKRMQEFKRSNEAIKNFKERVEERQMEVVDMIEDRLKEKREEIKEKWEGRKAQLNEDRKERIKKLVGNMVRHAEKVIERLATLADKISARIDKLPASATEEAKAKLEIAKNKIADAKAALDVAKTKLGEVYDAENPGEAFEEGRVIFEEVRRAISEAKRDLVDVINSIKGLEPNTATSTSPTATSSANQ